MTHDPMLGLRGHLSQYQYEEERGGPTPWVTQRKREPALAGLGRRLAEWGKGLTVRRQQPQAEPQFGTGGH